ncbi:MULTISPECIES: OmpA family protein [Photorhabdus]|uniref:OmpA family protein n=1 Tax=Photorhabdus TaxID=29487 RepID=UPI00292A507C|nr:OmpA family protein [Photorhabdus kayaii]
MGGAIILLFTPVGLFYTGRSRRREQLDCLSAGLPPDGDRRPVVLVCGHVQDSLFGDERGRQTPQGYWLCLPSGTALSDGVASLLAARPAWGGQLSVMAVINPQQYRDETALAGWVRELRWQLSQARRRQGIPLPLVLTGYLAGESQRPDPPWFAWQAGQNTVTVWRKGVSGQPLADWLGEGSVAEQSARFQCGVELTGWADWMRACVLPACLAPEDGLPPCPPQAMALTFVPALPQRLPGHLWQQWLQAKTALNNAGDPVSSPETGMPVLPFPDPVWPLFPVRSWQTVGPRALRGALGLFMLAGMTALGCSAWHNRQGLRQVDDDWQHYQAVAMTDARGKAQAMAVLRADAGRLEEYYRHGVPWHLGLGLYQGARLRLPLQAAIAGYSPEHQAKKPVTTALPQTISLNSPALFDVGRATLKPGSAPGLINALIALRAKPGRMILITGHTDATGNAAKNQALSLARAEAVRDWLLQTGELSPACFAVHGDGATRPIATNTTAAGRAANRRVEIRLIPNAVACPRPQTVPGVSATTSPIPATSLRQQQE